MDEGEHSEPGRDSGAVSPAEVREVVVDVGPVRLAGDLAMPPAPKGVVLFAHGSGSSRLSPRNRLVAQVLQRAGLATLLMDLLTTDEEAVDSLTGQLRFDIGLLAGRLIGATGWLAQLPETAGLRVGYFGASTGAAAALVAAARLPVAVSAVVSRGGRPDLAGTALGLVRAPTLLIVGGRDQQVVDLNRQAMAEMATVTELVVIPGATHLFEEPGALEEVALVARGWFEHHLGPS